MQLFGLVWLTSWVSYLLASSQGLFKVPDHLTSNLNANVFSIVGNPLESSTPIGLPTPLSLGLWPSPALATGPSSTLNMETTANPWQPQLTHSTIRVRRDAVKNAACHSPGNVKNDSLTTPSSSRHLLKATLPQKIWHHLQHWLPWPQQGEPTGKLLAESVVVVSTYASGQVTPKNKAVPRAKQGLWRYTQWLAGRAVAADASTKPEQFQVWVKGHLIAQFPNLGQADVMAQRLKFFFLHTNLHTFSVEADFWKGVPAIKAGANLLLQVDDFLAANLSQNRELLAIEWANNLRMALGETPLKLAVAQKQMYNLVETPSTFEGLASWYGSYFHGRATATGETYNHHEFTAAHPSLPFNTYLKVRNKDNGNTVIVRINDRGPFVPNRSLDLSQVAIRCLDGETAGVIPFEAIIMRSPSTQSQDYLSKN